MQLLHYEFIFTKTPDGGRRHLEFLKIVRYFFTTRPIITKFDENDESHKRRKRCITSTYVKQIKMVDAAILNFGNRLPLLHYWPNIIYFDRIVGNLPQNADVTSKIHIYHNSRR